MPLPQVSTGMIADSAVTQAKVGSGVAGTGPAFSAYPNSNQTLAGSTWTKAQINTEDFDTNSCFDSTTNYRFTPNVAGYYKVTFMATCYAPGGASAGFIAAIYKNGSAYRSVYGYSTSGSNAEVTVDVLMYLNGSTDYVEFYVYSGTANFVYVSGGGSTVNAYLARAA